MPRIVTRSLPNGRITRDIRPIDLDIIEKQYCNRIGGCSDIVVDVYLGKGSAHKRCVEDIVGDGGQDHVEASVGDGGQNLGDCATVPGGKQRLAGRQKIRAPVPGHSQLHLSPP